MKIKYSPCQHNKNTHINIINDNTVMIDEELYEFDPFDIAWPLIGGDTKGVILEAHRENEELFLTIRRFYTESCVSWDDQEYHEVLP